ncbi:MAG: energy-coupling factor transporter transmembrane protein EcfT [Lachnospiraceae bacterium]|nr:energy-coupling factor transporter transmembrane protein EcfT [Lachnospiraceae bacterium]
MVLRHKLLEKQGLGFIHPWMAFIYLLLALLLTMCTMNPMLIAISLVASISYEIHSIGLPKFVKYIPWLVLIFIITTIGNMFISHNGMHVLFYVNDNRITLESGIYGGVFGLMFAAAFLWCDITQRIITGEKLTYMFGSFAPNVGLVISMTLHYIPVIKNRLQVVHNAQVGMGRGKKMGALARAKQWGKEFSIVISWSLENSIDTSNVMTAMGYGVERRSNYSNYRVKLVDFIFLICILAMAIPGFVVIASNGYKVYYYPSFGMMCELKDMLAFILCYFVYMIIPFIAERFFRWH